jgi:hypothetical protein
MRGELDLEAEPQYYKPYWVSQTMAVLHMRRTARANVESSATIQRCKDTASSITGIRTVLVRSFHIKIQHSPSLDVVFA